MTDPDSDIVILYRGGRLPSWDQLPTEDQAAFQQEHVDLMLDVAQTHRLREIMGYRLLAPAGDWHRFWTMRFPDLAGAEAWMKAEVAPPYGRYGYYEYELARPWRPESLAWMPRRRIERIPNDPHVVPALSIDANSFVLICFSCWRPGSDEVSPHDRGDAQRADSLRRVADTHGLMHGEAFRHLGTSRAGELVWILEFPDLAGAEAWIDAEAQPPAGSHSHRSYHLARRWAPGYFAAWTG